MMYTNLRARACLPWETALCCARSKHIHVTSLERLPVGRHNKGRADADCYCRKIGLREVLPRAARVMWDCTLWEEGWTLPSP